MKRGGVFGVSVRSCEVDGHDHVELQSSSEIVDEGRFLEYGEGLEDQRAWFFYFRIG
jgi:hypothetical protein